MTPTEFQKLQKQYEDIGSKIALGQRLLNDMNELSILKKQVSEGNSFELTINGEIFYLNYMGLDIKNIKQVFLDLIEKQYEQYMKQWEELK